MLGSGRAIGVEALESNVRMLKGIQDVTAMSGTDAGSSCAGPGMLSQNVD